MDVFRLKAYAEHDSRINFDSGLQEWLEGVAKMDPKHEKASENVEDALTRLFAYFDTTSDPDGFYQAFWFTRLPWWMLFGRRRKHTNSSKYERLAKEYALAHPARMTGCGCKIDELARARQSDHFDERFVCPCVLETRRKRQEEARRQRELEEQRAEEERLAKMTPYERYLQSERWEALRQKVFDRDRRRCRRCGHRSSLHCHHLHYENLFDEPLEDLVTMCKDCHKEVHKFPELHPDWVQYNASAQRKREPQPPPSKKKPATFGFGSADVGDRTMGLGLGEQYDAGQSDAVDNRVTRRDGR